MHLKQIQEKLGDFERSRGWDKFPASLVFVHLIEELGEISRHITIEEGYKAIGLGHNAPEKNELDREFAQVFNLFAQLANHYDIDLERSVLSELEIMEKRFAAKEWSEYMKNRRGV
jgi:NTP pyrophosphatase (non-canonical NTP hydrolase)